MTQEEKPLFIILTPKERERLLTLLEYEGVDTRSPVAIKDWVLYQIGIEPEVQDDRYRNLAQDLCGGERP